MGSKKRKDKEKDRDREPEKEKDRDSKRDRKRKRGDHENFDEDYQKRERREPSVEDKRGEKRERDRPGSRKDSESDRKRIRDHERDDERRQRRDSNSDEEIHTSSAGGDISLSVDETNRLRAKLGLRPLQTTEKPKEEKDSLKDDIHVPAVNLNQKRKSEQLREKISVAREKRIFKARLNAVKTLGESDEDDNALDWIEKSRKIEEKRNKEQLQAKMKQQLEAEFNETPTSSEDAAKQHYDSKDLSGLKIEHSIERFKEGKSVILTLKDKGVLEEDEGDVLVNVNVIDNEKADENVKNKKTDIHYKGYDDGEYDEYGQYKARDILEKYNEEIGGKKIESFTLTKGGKYDASQEKRLAEIKAAIKSSGQSLKMEAPSLAKEYYSHAEMEEMSKFKKVKKKVRKVRRKVLKASELEALVPEDEEGKDLGRRKREEEEADPKVEKMECDEPQKSKKIVPDIVDDELFENDDVGPTQDLSSIAIEEEDVQREMEEARKAAIRISIKKEQLPPERLIDELLEREGEERGATTEGGNVNVMLDSTAEFCRNLGENYTTNVSTSKEKIEDMEMEDVKNPEPVNEETGKWTEVEEEEPEPLDFEAGSSKTGLEEEPIMNYGVAAALKLAANKGYLASEGKKAPTMSARKIQELSVKNYAIEDRRYDDIDDKFHRKRERYSGLGAVSDFKELSNYKPDVKLDYVDSQGKLLTPKEAFRQLSHRFHGKGPGKKKTEKRIKKQELEHMINHMSSSDTPLGSASLLYDKQIKEKTPFVVLSGGGKAFSSAS